MATGDLILSGGSLATGGQTTITPGANAQLVHFLTTTSNTLGDTGEVGMNLYCLRNSTTTYGHVKDGLNVNNNPGTIFTPTFPAVIHNESVDTAYYVICLEEL